MDILKANAKRDLFLLDKKNVIFIPQDWPVEDYGKDDGGLHIMCYAPLYTVPNSSVDTLWTSVADLGKLREITEEKAREVHPALFVHLDKINRGELEDTGTCSCGNEPKQRTRRA